MKTLVDILVNVGDEILHGGSVYEVATFNQDDENDIDELTVLRDGKRTSLKLNNILQNGGFSWKKNNASEMWTTITVDVKNIHSIKTIYGEEYDKVIDPEGRNSLDVAVLKGGEIREYDTTEIARFN